MRNRAVFPEHTFTPFYAVADMLQQSFHWDASHSVVQRLAALEASLGWPDSTLTRPCS
jgi:hypothetical protein